MASDDCWSIATGEDGDKPLIFRIRNQAPSFAHRRAFPHLLAVCWEYEAANDMGMPASDVTEGMGQFEDLVLPALENANQAFLSVVVTGNGVREWQWYSRDPNETMELVNEALAACDPFPIQISVQEDPDWETYARFVGAQTKGRGDT
jgi:Family of unknown function (DUF695)